MLAPRQQKSYVILTGVQNFHLWLSPGCLEVIIGVIGAVPVTPRALPVSFSSSRMSSPSFFSCRKCEPELSVTTLPSCINKSEQF